MSNTTVAHVQTTEEMQAEIIALREKNAKLEAERQEQAKNGMKISEKGALSVYGLGRFPVTLYKSQWRKLLGMAQLILAFIAANEDKLTEKPVKVKDEVAA